MAEAGVRRAVGAHPRRVPFLVELRAVTARQRSGGAPGAPRRRSSRRRGVLRRRLACPRPVHRGLGGARRRRPRGAARVSERNRARLVFTAHSIPVGMSGAETVSRASWRLAARLVAERLGRPDWILVFQSRSGRPQDPWLEPDVCDYLRAAAADGLDAVVLCPLGVRGRPRRGAVRPRRRGGRRSAPGSASPCVGRPPVNDDPRFLDMMADVVRSTVDALPGRAAPAALPRGGAAGPLMVQR